MPPGKFVIDPHLASQGDSVKIFRAAHTGSGKPEFIASSGPHDPFQRNKPRRKFLLVAIHVNHRHGTLVVALGIFVIGECHQLTVWRDFRMTDPVNAVQ